MLTEHTREFCQVSPGPFPCSAHGPGYEARNEAPENKFSGLSGIDQINIHVHQYIKILTCVCVCVCVRVSVCLSVHDGSGMFVGRD